MNHREVSISTADGLCDASLHTPAGEGSWPAIIMFTDAGGVRPTFWGMADRLAALGYAVLLPNLYYRAGPFEPFDMSAAFSDADERARMMTLVATVTTEGVTGDIGAMLDFLAVQPDVEGTAVGATGYCMGGGLSLRAAGRFPERVVAAASFHGGGLVSADEDSPHLLIGRMKARVYVAAAANDPWFDDEQLERLSQALAQAELEYTLVTYPARHGFAVPDTPAYDEAAAERHWRAMEELYRETLSTA